MLLHLTQLLNNFLWFSRCRFLNRIGGKFVGKAPSFEPSSAIQINKYLYISQVLFQNISILSKAVNFLAPISSRKDYLKIKLEVFLEKVQLFRLRCCHGELYKATQNPIRKQRFQT
jgi:uncharacterized membrane protein required for colicin V production